MRITSGIKTKSALIACLLTTAIAMPAWSDTLVLRNGVTISGTLNMANSNTITFRDRRGDLHAIWCAMWNLCNLVMAPINRAEARPSMKSLA